MQFGFLGINYKKANLDIRDKTSFTDVMKMEFFQKAEEDGIDQCMIISTCNRSEVFFFFTEEKQFATIREIYQNTFSGVELGNYLMELEKEEAMAYLFRVTAGLESLVLGEDQILGQVKEALDFSRTMGHSKKELNKVVRDAITCAKKIKTELKISEKPLSVSYIGIQKLNELCGIHNKKVLVIGSGKTAILTLKYLYEYQAGKVTVCSRTLAHAKNLLREFPEINVIEYDERYQQMEDCDIVVSATASPHLVLKKDEFVPATPLMLLDLAAPRDIDTAFADMDNVKLINLDTLQEIVHANQKERESLVEESKHMIAEALEETCAWLLQSRMDGTIQSLQNRCSEIVDDSYEYLDRKLSLSGREQKILKKVLNASLQRLLREPIQELKLIDTREEQEAYKKVVQKLFQMEE